MRGTSVLTRSSLNPADRPSEASPAAGPAEPDLDQLALAARDGDREAFAGLYLACAPAVYRYCYARTRNGADADDLLQQTFLRVVESLPRYEDRGVPFRAWLFRICRTVTIDAHRRRRPQLPLDETAELPAPDGIAVGATGGLLDDVLDAIDNLTGDQRMVIQLRFFGNLSAREAGVAMGRDELAVRALQARAIASLRRSLGVTRAPVLVGAAFA